jgi:hypothetical protein
MTKVLARTIAISSNREPFPLFAVGNIESVEVLNWCNVAGFSIYAEDGLKRYCLWSVTSFVQRRGNLYGDSRLAKQLETIGRGAHFRRRRRETVVARMKRSVMRERRSRITP